MDSQFLFTFLKNHIDREKPVGLAYSGGADSEVLYQLFLNLRTVYPLRLHILHVNHNWREESQKQADDLEKKVIQDGLIFHKKSLPSPSSVSNLEEKGRQARLQFFQEIAKKYSLQGIFLAHHKDDLSETVLKKVLEGSHLIHLSSLKAVQKMGQLTLYRPLLEYTKQELKEYLSKKNTSYLEDPTNLDTRYLRARLRGQILPKLSDDFGKSVLNNLAELSKRSEELLLYFKDTLPFPEKIAGPFGHVYDYNGLDLAHPLEWKILLLFILKKEQVVLSKEFIDSIVKSLIAKSAHKQFQQNKMEVISDRGFLFILKRKSRLFAPFSLKVESISKIDTEKRGWKHFWRNDISIHLPDGKYFLTSISDMDPKERKKIQKQRTNQKIPTFLRKSPVIVSEDGDLIDDLLSWKRREERALSLKISFE